MSGFRSPGAVKKGKESGLLLGGPECFKKKK